MGLDVPVSDLLAMSEGEQVFQLIHKNESAIIERDQGRCVFYMISPLTMAERLELYTLEIKKGGEAGQPGARKRNRRVCDGFLRQGFNPSGQ